MIDRKWHFTIRTTNMRLQEDSYRFSLGACLERRREELKVLERESQRSNASARPFHASNTAMP